MKKFIITMNTLDKATEFVIFCIENTAARIDVPGSDIYRELKKTDGIKSFLYPSYDTLHTQSKDYIVDEILTYIKQQNPNFLTAKRT